MREQKPIVYIACEGKTEKKYFEQLSRILDNSFKVIPYDLGGGTLLLHHPEVVKRKIKKKIEHDKITGLVQKVFIVFDLDIFEDKSKLQNTQNILRDYDFIYNNECFEYWILSHFKKYDLGKGKKRYLDEIRNFLPNLPEGKEYKMTGDEDYNWLENTEKVETAITNVKEVNKDYGNFKDRDPYSDVYKIIDFLRNLK